MPHVAGRVRRRCRRRAHGLVRRAGGDGGRGHRRSTSGSGSRRSRSRSGALRPWTSPRCARSARRCPDADLYVDANRGWSYDDAVRAGDALAELGVRAIEEPISIEDRAGRLRLAERWVGAAGRRRELHQPRARRPRARGGRGPGRERQDGADRASPSRAGSSTSASPATSRSSWAASTRARSARSATIAFAAAFAATAGQPAEITNFLDLADDLVVAAPEIRDGRATVAGAPGLGVEVDEERLQRYRVDR